MLNENVLGSKDKTHWLRLNETAIVSSLQK
jgi:hypothetical protein